ncbi:hypothetical protein BH09PLA1_BH09PLA1_33350 [soil metagenome]
MRSDSDAGSFLSETPATLGDDEPTIHQAASVQIQEGPGSMIGPYKLLQQIGEGGFGSVFMAEQEQPVKRRVALKIIKLGMDTRQVVARFEQERQALAMMDHTNIAKVFDAGTTSTGRPFFVMELCRGESITDYCDRANLTIPQRLELFAQVCAAVQHAHTKGIIHRDIKPSNVLVSTQDGRPHVKVIDFGIAKATASKLTEKTLFTAFSQMVGTPQYMSPEQAEGSFDIDTRTDVYALGVLLYELLTGVTPFDPKSLRGAAYGEIERIIREVEPPSPSARLSQNTATIASVAASRRTEPRKLGTIVRGELDWIVMKALEKDRQRRYETANGLAADINRYLSGEAVQAAPVSTVYRLKKFVRRNKGLVTAAGAVAAALLIGVIGFAWQASIARHQRDRAVVAEKDAKQRAAELTAVSDFQAKMLSQIDATDAGIRLMDSIRAKFAAALAKGGVPDVERATRIASFGRELLQVNATDTAVEMIDRTILKPAIAAVDTQFKDQPIVDASLRHTVADIYRILGLYDDALPLQTAALATRRRVLGDSNEDTLTSINNMGSILDAEGKPQEAEKYYREGLDQRSRVLGAENHATLVSMGNLGNLFCAQGKFAEAEPLLRASLEKCRRVLGNDHRDTIIAINSLGFLLVNQGKPAEAEPLWREAYERGQRAIGADDPDVIVWISNLGSLIQVQGRFKEAEPYLREALEKNRRVRGEEHPLTIRAISILGGNLSKQGRLTEAETLDREALEKSQRVLGDDNPETVDNLGRVGSLLMAQGKFDDAEPCLRQSLDAIRRLRGDEHPTTLNALAQFARLRVNQGKRDEAEALYRDVLEKSSRVLGPEHPDTLINTINLGNLLVSRHIKLDEAESLIRKAMEGRRRLSGDNHPETLIAQANYARLLEVQGKFVEAEALYREVLEKFRRVSGNDHPNTLSAIENLASLLRGQGKWSEAEPLFTEAIAIWQRTRGEDDPRAANSRVALGKTLAALNRFTEAEQQLLDADRVLSAASGVSVNRRLSALEALQAMYVTWNAAEPTPGLDVKVAEVRSKIDKLSATTRPTTVSTSK